MRFVLLAVIALGVSGCSLDVGGADDAGGGSCEEDEADFTCELVVDTRAECPSWESLCAGRCGGGYDCCYCGADGMYTTLFTDCEPCPDAATEWPDAESPDAESPDAASPLPDAAAP
jgi:hypothetical protein